MSAHDNGGPAFPVIDASQNTATGETTVHQAMHSGISVRDYFAAKALVAVIGTLKDGREIRNAMAKAGVSDPLELVARNAYDLADAMLKARQA